MVPYVFAHPSLTLFLAVFTPVLAMIALHVRRFYLVQIKNSLYAAGVFGALLAVCGALLPPMASAAVAAVVVCVLSERLVVKKAAAIFGEKATVLGYIAASCAFVAAMTHFQVFWAANAALAASLMFFGVWYSRVKDYPTGKTIDERQWPPQNDFHENIVLKKKPNIYCFYLESMHSKSGIEAIYKHDDFGFTDYLDEKGFTVYPETLSSGLNTYHSLNMLLGMRNKFKNPRVSIVDTGYKPVLSALRHNKYTINLYDRGYHIFKDIFHYADKTNCVFPKKFAWVFMSFGPIAVLSSFFVRFFSNADSCNAYFSDDCVCASMLHDARKKDNSPQFNLIRIGNEHYPTYGIKNVNARTVETNLAAKKKWRTQYIERYKKTTVLCREVIDTILELDNSACVIVIGDHGSFGEIPIEDVVALTKSTRPTCPC